MPAATTMGTDDFVEYFIQDGFTPKQARRMVNLFIIDKAFQKKADGGNSHNVFSLWGAKNNYTPDRPGTNKEYYNKRIKTLNPATRRRVAKALKTKREKRMAKEAKSRRRKLKIGCEFRNIGYIKEYEDDQIYIPPSDYCFIRCVEKVLGKEISKVGLNPYGNTLTKLRMTLKDVIAKEELPSVISISYSDAEKKKKEENDDFSIDQHSEHVVVDEDKELDDILIKIENGDEDERDDCVIKTFTPIDKAKKNILERFKILLCNINDGEYHAVLVKLKPDENATQKFYRQRYDHIWNNMDYVQKLDLCADQVKIRLPKHKKMINKCVVFDIETSSKIIYENDSKISDKKENEEMRLQVPEGVAYSILDFNTMTYSTPKKCTGVKCYTKFLNDICHEFIEINKKEEEDGLEKTEKILIFSHNGGNFDNLYAKGLQILTHKKQIKKGRVKMLETTHDPTGKTLIFLDSYSFLNSKLKDACDFFDIENKKMEFDIINKDHNFFVKTNKWKTYMTQDVVVLAEILLKFEKMIRDSFGESITTSMCGIPSMAWSTLCSRSYGMNKVYRSKDPTTQSFINESTYGGRIIHNKKLFDCETYNSKGLICLDGNSLHPSAMFIAEYPIGKFKVIAEMDTKSFMREYIGRYLYIVEITLDAGNIRYPLLPYRTEGGCIIYPNGIFTGVYCSVDLEEALNDGYKILSFKRGVYWSSSKKIFSNTIEELYNIRKKLQTENNPMEYIYKLILNAIYGYMSLSINNSTIFSKEESPEMKNGSKITSTKLLKNGQYEHKITYRRPLIEKPNHLAAFILANARKIMNNHIRKIGPENIWYGDTDSLYVPIECVKTIKQSSDLCGLKNDYGDNLLIKNAIFLDTKRYFLEFNKLDKKGRSYTAKFNGLNFKDDMCLKNWSNDKDKQVSTRKLYKWFYDNPNKISDIKIVQERWMRNDDNVVINTMDLAFQVNPNVRYNWDGDTSYPIKLNNSDVPVIYKYKNIKFTKLGKQTKFSKEDPYLYEIGPSGLFSSQPLTYDKLNKSKDVTIESFKTAFDMTTTNENFRTTFVKSKENGQIYKRVGNDFYIYDNTKAQQKINQKKIGAYEELLIIPYINPYPKLTQKDLDFILQGVESCLKG